MLMNTQNSKISHRENDEISLKRIVLNIQEWSRYLVSRWVIIVLFAVLGGAIGLMYSYLKKPVYIASTTFVLEEGVSGGSLGQYAGIASMIGIDIGADGGGIFEGDNIIELYKSRSMIEKALLSTIEYKGETQLLIDRYIDFNKLRKKWTDKPALANIQFYRKQDQPFTRLQDSVLSEVVKNINKKYLTVAKLDKKLSIIKVEVKAKDELFAKTFNDQIVKKVNDFYVQTKTKKSLENVTILQHQTDSVKKVMERAVYSSVASMDETPNLNPTRQVLRASVQRSQFAAETNKAILTELIKNLEMTKITLRKETPLIQVIDEPVFPLEKERLGKIKGIVLGCLLFGFLSALFLLSKKIYSDIIL